MLHKLVKTGKTDDKCNKLLKSSCYACCQDYFFSFFAKLDILIATIGIITIETGMSGTILGIGIVMIKKELQFSL